MGTPTSTDNELMERASRALVKNGLEALRTAVLTAWTTARVVRPTADGFAGHCDRLYEREFAPQFARTRQRQGDREAAALCLTWADKFRGLGALPFAQRSSIGFSASQPATSGVIPAPFDPRPLIKQVAALGVTLSVGPDGLQATPAGILDSKLRKQLVDHASEVTQALRTPEVLR